MGYSSVHIRIIRIIMVSLFLEILFGKLFQFLRICIDLLYLYDHINVCVCFFFFLEIARLTVDFADYCLVFSFVKNCLD